MLRGALRHSVRAGVVQPLPLKTLALMLTGAIIEGCMAIADAEEANQVRADLRGEGALGVGSDGG